MPELGLAAPATTWQAKRVRNASARRHRCDPRRVPVSHVEDGLLREVPKLGVVPEFAYGLFALLLGPAVDPVDLAGVRVQLDRIPIVRTIAARVPVRCRRSPVKVVLVEDPRAPEPMLTLVDLEAAHQGCTSNFPLRRRTRGCCGSSARLRPHKIELDHFREQLLLNGAVSASQEKVGKDVLQLGYRWVLAVEQRCQVSQSACRSEGADHPLVPLEFGTGDEGLDSISVDSHAMIIRALQLRTPTVRRASR